MNNLILHIPHSSTTIPLKEGFCVSNEILNQELLKLTDWYTDDLFENKIDISVKAHFSRIFCDTERFSDDSQEIMSKFGMGVLYEKTDSGELLRKITLELRSHILENYYWKHHNKLTESVQLQLEEQGKAIIVDCHSFPSKSLIRTLIKTENRPDFNIGTDSFHTPKQLVEKSIAFFTERGFSLGVDTPYTGAIVPMEYFHKNKKVQSIMLEVNRKLYLDESIAVKSTQYNETKQVIQDYLTFVRD